MPEGTETTTDATTTDATTAATTDAPSTTEKTLSFTQEKLDRIIGAKLAEERAKFSDYDELKAAKARLDEVEAANLSDAEKVQRERDEAKAAADASAARVAELEAESLRNRVALETKLPPELVPRLKGDTEDALREDAASLLKLIGVKPPADFDAGARKTPPAGITREQAIELLRTDPTQFNAKVASGDIPADVLA